MQSNILIAIKNIIDTPILKIKEYYYEKNRINSIGKALEEYVKDIFANTINVSDEYEKTQIYNEIFCYLGNQNNPPDIILKNGDAIEVKKNEEKSNALALNSSYPKAKLYSDSTMITESCRICEKWEQKDIIYIVGNIEHEKIKSLWFVYGDCYAADREIYERIKNKISKGLGEIPAVELVKTNELGKIKKVDPLGITDLRIRGMWHILHPQKVFEYIPKKEFGSEFKFYCVMKKEKFDSFPDKDKNTIINITNSNAHFFISDIKIKNPNNPANLIDAKFMEFYYGK